MCIRDSPEAGQVPATRRSEATPRPRVGCPPPSAAGLIMTVKHHAHGQNELFRPGLLPSRSPPGQEERQVSFPGGEQPSRRPAAKKQKIVPQSSCEAETYALNAGCRALIFIKNLLAELNTTVELPMATHTDNDAARLTAINPGTTARTKHFESWLRYVRELYLNLVITVNWVPTKEQIADLFTKPLDKTTFLYLRSLLMTEQR